LKSRRRGGTSEPPAASSRSCRIRERVRQEREEAAGGSIESRWTGLAIWEPARGGVIQSSRPFALPDWLSTYESSDNFGAPHDPGYTAMGKLIVVEGF